MGKPGVRSRISAPRPGDERRDVPAAPGFSAADVWKEHTLPSRVACLILGGSLTGCLMRPRVGIEARSDPDPTAFFAQLWSVLTYPLPARPTERELHAALDGIETTPHPHTTTRRHRAITLDHPQRSSLPLSRMHPPTPFLPLRPRSSTRLHNCYGNVVWRARRMGSLPPREGAAGGGGGARSCGPAGTRSVQEKRYFGRREMGMGKGTLRVGSRGRASAGEAHASGRVNRPYAVRERAGGWEVLPDSAVALGVDMPAHGKTQHRDWDQDRDPKQQRVREKACLLKMRKGWGDHVYFPELHHWRGDKLPRYSRCASVCLDPPLATIWTHFRRVGQCAEGGGGGGQRKGQGGGGFCQPERSLPTHDVLQVLYILSEGAIGLWGFGRAVKEMPLLAFALTYGSFGDIKETFTMAWRLYKILRDRGGSSDEIQKVLKVLECHRADITTLISLLQTDSPPDAQQFRQSWIGAIRTWPSYAPRLHHRRPFSPIYGRPSQWREHWRPGEPRWQIIVLYCPDNCNYCSSSALSIDGHQQLQRMASQIQYAGAEVERVKSEVRETGSLIMATTAKQISDAESNFMQRLIQGINLHHVSVAMFSVTDPLGQSIPISLAHCGDFEALDRMLKACIFNRPEAGARYVERGDYNLFLPEGTIVRRVDFSRTVKSGMQLDMSIIKRPRFPRAPDLEKCPYCNEENPKTAGNEWIHCSNHQCGRRYQISAKQAEEIKAIEEIYSPQLLTKGDETRTQEQEKEDKDLFRLVEIQATYDVSAGVH
ncbi:hypothetical protein B0H14DRAFT_3741626 [Mycena olivaceomarginata]|nr:hypothetical protein B0H14DRAFT_3741626 [Mycena olivaceomarginata]